MLEVKAGLSAHGLMLSVLMHLSVLLLVLNLPRFLEDPNRTVVTQRGIIYDVQKLDLSSYLPNLKPPGPGGKPGRGIRPDRAPALGSTAFHPRLTQVSNPRLPDNTRQTIIQTASPPELRIPFEIRLPNILSSGSVPTPKLPVKLALGAPRPRRQKNPSPSAIPEVPQQPPQLALALPPSPNPFPKLAVPAPPPPPLETAAAANTKGDAGPGSTGEEPREGGGLIALSVDPGSFSDLLLLPPGNRYGSFSISPAGGQPGSPGGVPGGDPRGGTGGPGSGGDGSVGVGPGGNGGGGKETATQSGMLSIAGGEENGAGVLASPIIASRVYPIVSPARLPRNSLLITAGPVGGGGLRVYGVLRGGKVYTTYLPMPGKNWILQYCERKDLVPVPETPSGNRVVNMEERLVPPWAEERFDFHRPLIPRDKAHETIVLHGVIQGDGKVVEVKVLQGVHPEADQAAVAAFQRWKFRPALQGGEPITVEVLVGIPATVPSGQQTSQSVRHTDVSVPPRNTIPQP